METLAPSSSSCWGQTIVLVDAHEGFSVITDRIKTSNKVADVILSLLTFFFSAVLDNLPRRLRCPC